MVTDKHIYNTSTRELYIGDKYIFVNIVVINNNLT